ncbi:MAG: hypothetical protein ACI4AM_10570 [Muribaculaceae bacterium]
MNTISVQQPWGTIICCGLKDVENRTWALKSTPMRLLIHVGARAQRGQDDNNMPMYYYRHVENYQIMGILPSLADVPKSAIVGVATVEKCVTDSESEWAQPGATHWLLKDAKLFKEPVTGVKGKLGIFDYPAISEDNLPECVDIPRITRDGTHVTMPLAASKLEELRLTSEDQPLYLNYTAEIDDIFFDGDELRDIKSFTFLVDGSKVEAKVDEYDFINETYEDGTEITFHDYEGNEYVQQRLIFYLKF